MSARTLLLVVLGLGLAASACSSPPGLGLAAGRSMPGAPYNIRRDDRGVQQLVLRAACSFNNQSNDAFLFRASSVRRAQRQVVKGTRYIVDFDISRTVCRKRDKTNLSDCDFQPVGRLHQTFQCHIELWTIPWRNVSQTQVFFCKGST